MQHMTEHTSPWWHNQCCVCRRQARLQLQCLPGKALCSARWHHSRTAAEQLARGAIKPEAGSGAPAVVHRLLRIVCLEHASVRRKRRGGQVVLRTTAVEQSERGTPEQ